MTDNLKLIAAGLLVVLGVAGFYLLADMPSVVRVLSVLLGLVAAGAVAWLSAPGKAFYAFSQDAVVEARKVVWPTRKETLQMTGVVIAFVIVMALFLWMVDGSLTWLVRLLMGRSD